MCRSACSIPEHFPYVFLYFDLVFRTRLSRNLGYIEVIFISFEKFSMSFTLACVEFKISVQKMILEKKEITKESHFGRRFIAVLCFTLVNG